MTTSFVMPYGYTVGGKLNATWQGRMDGKGAHVHLPEGPCRVSASWSGPEKAVLSLVRPDERVVLAEIPAQAGGGASQLTHGHHRRCQGRQGTPGMLPAHHDHSDRNRGSLACPSRRLTPKAVV